MALIRSLKRQRQRSKRLDLSPLADVLRDGRMWTALGVVSKADGASSHWQMHTDEDGQTDILVDVELIPSQLDLTCRLGSTGGSGRGVWQIPHEGDEVAVIIPEGKVAFQPLIVAVLSSGGLPDGVAENVTVIADASVLIHDGAGGANELVTGPAFKAHKHPSGSGPTGVADNALDPNSYTQVFKAK